MRFRGSRRRRSRQPGLGNRGGVAHRRRCSTPRWVLSSPPPSVAAIGRGDTTRPPAVQQRQPWNGRVASGQQSIRRRPPPLENTYSNVADGAPAGSGPSAQFASDVSAPSLLAVGSAAARDFVCASDRRCGRLSTAGTAPVTRRLALDRLREPRAPARPPAHPLAACRGSTRSPSTSTTTSKPSAPGASPKWSCGARATAAAPGRASASTRTTAAPCASPCRPQASTASASWWTAAMAPPRPRRKQATSPSYIVGVDLAAPQAELRAAEPGQGALAGQVLVRWSAADDNLAAAPGWPVLQRDGRRPLDDDRHRPRQCRRIRLAPRPRRPAARIPANGSARRRRQRGSRRNRPPPSTLICRAPPGDSKMFARSRTTLAATARLLAPAQRKVKGAARGLACITRRVVPALGHAESRRDYVKIAQQFIAGSSRRRCPGSPVGTTESHRPSARTSGAAEQFIAEYVGVRSRLVPAGRHENSPAFQCWVSGLQANR